MADSTDPQPTTREGADDATSALRAAAGGALERAGLPDDLLERTAELPGTPFEHARAFAAMPDGDRANLRKAFKVLADFPMEAVTVTVKKPNPPIKGSSIDYAAVTIHRQRAGK